MAEDTTQSTQEPSGQVQEPHGDGIDWKAMSRKWEDRAKSNKEEADQLREKAAKWDEAQEAGKSELQRLQEQLEAAVAERDALAREKETAQWAKEVADEKHLPASVLRGSTKEEMLAHADSILASGLSYGSVPDGGESHTTTVTRESILAIKDQQQRLAAIKANLQLFS